MSLYVKDTMPEYMEKCKITASWRLTNQVGLGL